MPSIRPEGIRSAAEECERNLQTLNADISLDRQVYDALAATDATALDAFGKRALKKTLRLFKRAGVDRDDATRARLKALSDEMVRLGQDFSRTIREDSRRLCSSSPPTSRACRKTSSTVIRRARTARSR